MTPLALEDIGTLAAHICGARSARVTAAGETPRAGEHAVPLRASDGLPVGAIVVACDAPFAPTDAQRRALDALARDAARHLELARALRTQRAVMAAIAGCTKLDDVIARVIATLCEMLGLAK